MPVFDSLAKSYQTAFTVSLHDPQLERDSVEKTSTSLLVVFLVRHITRHLHVYVADKWCFVEVCS